MSFPGILVVDDNPPFRAMVRLQLIKITSCHVFEADDPEMAFALLEKETFNMIVSDFDMPGMDGVDFFKALGKNPAYEQIPFIMISFEGRKEKLDKVEASGIEDYRLLYG